MVYVNCRTRFKATGASIAAVAVLLLGCSSAEVSETVRPELVDLDAPKSPSAGLFALADHAQSLNARGPQASNDTSAESMELEVDNRAFPSVAELCANFVAESKAKAHELLESFPDDDVHELKAPFCGAIAEPHPVPANAVYERAIAVRLSNGLWERKQLAVKLTRGFVLHPTYWDADDPLDPGCASIFRSDRIEALKIESGYLVVVETGPNLVDMDEDGTPHFAPKHLATWCKEAEGKLNCRSFEPMASASLDDFSIAPDGTVQKREPMLD